MIKLFVTSGGKHERQKEITEADFRRARPEIERRAQAILEARRRKKRGGDNAEDGGGPGSSLRDTGQEVEPEPEGES